jgi:hypothetical protein
MVYIYSLLCFFQSADLQSQQSLVLYFYLQLKKAKIQQIFAVAIHENTDIGGKE